MSDTRLDQVSWIDPLADRFEQAWKSGVRPRLEEYLQAVPEGQRGALLRALLLVELQFRQQQGDRPTPEEYQARLPEHGPLIQAVFRGASLREILVEPDVGQNTFIVATPAVARPRLGGHCGRYLLSRLHGEGGLGQVWVALDENLNREVALKALHPQHAANPGARRRFLREAQITGQLEHPNIVPIYELSRRPEDGQPFYTMHLVRGRTLRSAVREYHRQRRAGQVDPLALPRLLTALVSICQAVSFAHARGIVHRDLKPDNVMLGSFGEVIVLDWGLARQCLESSTDSAVGRGPVLPDVGVEMTAPGCVLGTPAYMAPEQAQGRLDLIDARTDVYGLGAILFEILTGKPPREGADSSEVVRRIIADPSPRARSVELSVPPALDAICARAMAKERADRYGCVADLTEDVQRFLADEPVSSYREPWLQRIARWARHHRTKSVAAVAALIGIVLAAAVANVRLSHLNVQLADLARQERAARVAAEEAQEAGIRMAARFASRTIAREVALRWAVMERAAADPDLRRLLKSLEGVEQLGPQPSRQHLEAWLQRQHVAHFRTTRATSWFITDAQGRHLARHPPVARLVGNQFTARDYFHARGRDLSEPTPGIAPLRDAHCSIVYVSRATGRRLIALSVTVWSEERNDPNRSVLAVLSRTVELGRFGALQINSNKAQIVALVDTRQDWVEGEARKGLVLHHPRLAELVPNDSSVPVKLPAFRLDSVRIELLERLCRTALEYERQQVNLSSSEPTHAPAALAEALARDYCDPVAGPEGGTWLAAFEPVIIRRPNNTVKDIGWVVIVQERQGKKSEVRSQKVFSDL